MALNQSQTDGLQLDVALLKQDVGGLKSDIADLTSGFKIFAAEVNRGRQWNWNIVGPLGVIGGAAVGGLAMFIQVQISPVRTDVTALQAAMLTLAQTLDRSGTWQREVDKQLQLNDARDSRSEQERADSKLRIDRMQDQLGKLAGDMIAHQEKLAEVETQFKADELLAAQRESNTEQWKGMFYEWLTGRALPQRGPVVPGIAAKG